MTKEQELPAKQKETDKPEDGKVYALTGAKGTACILNGNTWKVSVGKNKCKLVVDTYLIYDKH